MGDQIQPDQLDNRVRVFRPRELAERIGVSRATVYRRARQPDFPPKLQLGPRAVGWRASDIARWLDGLAEQGGDGSETADE